MPTFRSTTFTEWIGPNGVSQSSERFAPNNSGVVRYFDVSHDLRYGAVKDFLGHAVAIQPSANGCYISRMIPMSMLNWTRPSDSTPFLYAADCSELRGLGVPADKNMKDTNDVGRFAKARASIDFTARLYKILSDSDMIAAGYVDGNGQPDEAWPTLPRYVSKKVRARAQLLTLPTGIMKFAANTFAGAAGRPIPQAMGKPIGSVTLNVTHWQLPEEGVPSAFLNPKMPFPTQPPTVSPTGGGAGGGSMPAGNYKVKFAYWDPVANSASPASSESLQFTVAAGNIPRVTFPTNIPSINTQLALYCTATSENTADGFPGGPFRKYASAIAITVPRTTATTYDMSAASSAGSALGPATGLTYDNLLGKVNSISFLNYPPGTILYNTYEGEPYTNWWGELCYDISHQIEYIDIPGGHNFVPVQIANGRFGFVEASADGVSYPEPAANSVHLFDSADLRYLLRCPPSVGTLTG